VKVRSKRVPRVQVAAWCWLGLLLFGFASTSAQDLNRETSLRSDILKRAQAVTTPSLTETAFEGVLDRDAYKLGPGDKLILQVWSPAYEEVPMVVSGEGRLAIPFAGPVQVAGLTLTDAETAVAKEFDSALRRGRISLSLLEPRKFRVHVTGQVRVPGTVTVSATSRVADAVDMAGGYLRSLQSVGTDTVFVPNASLRGVELRNADGSVTPADLQAFYSGGSVGANPYVTDGATIYVPPKSTAPSVGVYGEVRLPGAYDYFPGDHVSSLIDVAGGLTALADSAQITLQRASGESVAINFSVASIATKVNPGDRVFVGGKPRDLTHGAVTISGQVARPGGYAITPGVTTVADVLVQAGGYLPTAAAQSARLVRLADERLASERNRIFANPAQKSVKDDPIMLADQELAAEFARWSYGTVVLDLTADEKEAGYAGHVVLQDGDHLEIPSQPLGVRVLGYVNHAGEVPWQEGASLGHYLNEAGGKNRAGWQGRTVILKARNGSQLRYSHTIAIDPGDILFVPQRPRTTSWERIKDVIAVVAQVATVVIVVDTATK